MFSLPHGERQLAFGEQGGEVWAGVLTQSLIVSSSPWPLRGLSLPTGEGNATLSYPAGKWSSVSVLQGLVAERGAATTSRPERLERWMPCAS